MTCICDPNYTLLYRNGYTNMDFLNCQKLQINLENMIVESICVSYAYTHTVYICENDK